MPSLKILIADDADILRQRVVGMVTKLSGVATVLESRDFTSTLRQIENERPDVVVLDFFMPGGTGLDVLRAIDAGSQPRPRVLVLTAWGDRNLRERCIEAGAEGVYEKGSHFLCAVDAIEAMVTEHRANGSAGDGGRRPVSAPAPLSAAPESGAGLPGSARGLRVLVVEDHDFQRKALTRQLTTLGALEVLGAADGQLALQMLRSRVDDIHLIVCDLDMPNMDGMEFIRHLGGTGSSAAVIITSALESSVMNSVQVMAQAYGIRLLGVIPKPATLDVLSGLLVRALAPSSGAVPGGRKVQAFSLDQILEGIRLRQFVPHFQPKVDVASGRIVGAEALARWFHPEHGVIAPAGFIEVLERAGAIDELTFLMLDQSAQACCGWRRRGLDLTVAINLSLVSLSDTLLAERIDTVVRKAGLEPRNVTLEVTETAAMTSVAPALENLARLRMRGFGLSIDDFGTGFASMQQLGRAAYTELKIDRGFVAAMSERREAQAIVEASIDIARRLGIVAVAEGVETAAEMQALREVQCPVAQGYFISRPVGEADFLKLCLQAA